MESQDFLSAASEWLVSNTIPIAIAIVILIVGWLLSRLVSGWIRRFSPNAQHLDQTFAPLLAQTARYGILIIAIMMALTQLGVQTTSILAVLGAAGLAIALALQGTLSNIAAGVMLVWLRPMAIGEYIDADSGAGTVIEIGLFATKLRSADGVFVFVPNSEIWNSRITNYSREPRRRLDLKCGIAYDADIATARKVMMKIATGDKRVLPDPTPVVHVESLGDSAVVMMLRIWVPTPDYWDVLFEFTERVKLDFDKAGVEIPYNKLDVNLLSTPESRTAAD